MFVFGARNFHSISEPYGTPAVNGRMSIAPDPIMKAQMVRKPAPENGVHLWRRYLQGVHVMVIERTQSHTVTRIKPRRVCDSAFRLSITIFCLYAFCAFSPWPYFQPRV